MRDESDRVLAWLAFMFFAGVTIRIVFYLCGCTLARQYKDDTGQSMAVTAYHVWHPDRNDDGLCDRFDEVRDEAKFRKFLQGG